MSITYQNVQYTYENHGISIIQQLCQMNSLNNMHNFNYAAIPVFKEDSVLLSNNGPDYWYNNYVKYHVDQYANQADFKDYEFISIPIMFDYHCKQLLSNGKLVKMFGSHDDATLISMYTNRLVKNKEQYEIAKQCVQQKDMKIKSIQKMLVIMKDLDEQYNTKHNALSQLYSYTYLSYAYINITPDEQYDLSKYIPIISNDAANVELNTLYTKYPEYTDDTKTYVHTIGSTSSMSYSSYLNDSMIIILRLTKEMVIKQLQKAMESYVPNTQSYTDSYGRTTQYTYTVDYQLQQLRNATFDQLIGHIDHFAEKLKQSGYNCEQGITILKALKTKSYIILKFNSNFNLIPQKYD